jgi:magnesium-transporting ATPase (P-type)
VNKILLGAAIVSIVIGVIKDGFAGLIDGLSILIALIIITAVNSINNYISERKLRDLIALSEK